MVIAAGGIVRMTQSGMGCPDWPTCFGMWIPPMSAEELPPDFEKYLSKQDIDHTFNVFHTWTEYINRLFGALLGVFIIIHLVWSVRKYRWSNPRIMQYSLLMFTAVIFQGWLGKLVVDGNLQVRTITIHMIGAIILAILPLCIISILKESRSRITNRLRYVLLALLVCSFIQIVLGTGVREEIDVISKSLGYESRELWMPRLGNEFIIHRTFSWVILLLSMYFTLELKKIQLSRYGILQFIVLLAIIILGIIMNYMNIPAWAQPLHLLTGCFYFCVLFYIGLRTRV